MSDRRRFRTVDLIPFLLVLATAAGARVGYLVTYADNATSSGPWVVQDASPKLAVESSAEMPNPAHITELDALSTNVEKHGWFGSLAPFADVEEQTAHAAPGYPWLVGKLRSIIPAEIGPADRSIRWLQCLLGTVTAGLYYLIARRAFPSRTVALLAGLLVAVHPFWIVSTPVLNDGVLTAFLLAACLFLACRGSQVEGALTSLFLGLALAALALVRAALLPFSFVLLLWFLRRSRRMAGGWQFGLLALLGFVIGMAPWTQRNIQEFGDILPVVDSMYLHLWIGNNPRASGGPMSESEQRAAVSPELLAKMSDPAIRQPARYLLLAHEVVRELHDQPAQTIERRLWAGLYFFFGADWFTQHRLWGPADPAATNPEPPPYPALWLGSLLLMLLLGVLGWRWTFAWRTEAQPLAVAVMWVPLPYLLSHAEGLCGPRLPLDGVLLCYSAFVLACLAPNLAPILLRPRGKRLD